MSIDVAVRRLNWDATPYHGAHFEQKKRYQPDFTVLNFTVEMRPDLPAGNYTIVRRIDIDPDEIWINYGHESIGTIEVLGDTNKAGVSLKAIGITTEVEKRIRTHEESVSEAGTDGITGLSIGEMLNPASLSMVISLVTLIVVIYLVVAKRKQ